MNLAQAAMHLYAAAALGQEGQPLETKFWFPEQAAEGAAKIDLLYMQIYWISLVFFAMIVVAMVAFCVLYRRPLHKRHKNTLNHNFALEMTWTIIPSLIVVWIFYVSFKEFMNLSIAPRNSYIINVSASQWKWDFTYPNGYLATNELHVPAKKPVRMVLASEDVLHAFFIPQFRVKKDVVPGRYHDVWFVAKHAGEYDLFCAEYCGTDHSNMYAKVVVHEPEDYDKWLVEASKDVLEELTPEEWEEYQKDPPAFVAAHPDKGLAPLSDLGKVYIQKRGCLQCHSLGTDRLIGPGYQGIFGKTEELGGGGTAVVDENYIRESILDPQAKVVKGYDNVMPTFKGKLTDRQITAVVEYIRSISK